MAEPIEPDRPPWQASIAAARAQANQLRAALKVENQRNKVDRSSEYSYEAERAQYASDQVLNDMSLQRGDNFDDRGIARFQGGWQRRTYPHEFCSFWQGPLRSLLLLRQHDWSIAKQANLLPPETQSAVGVTDLRKLTHGAKT